ncbi:hypothetical protein LINPERPRIM_LOCUS42759 [Linum perenne]
MWLTLVIRVLFWVELSRQQEKFCQYSFQMSTMFAMRR